MRLGEHRDVEREEQPTPEVTERVAVGGDEVVLTLLGHVRQQRIVELIAAPKPQRRHDVQDGSRQPIALRYEVQSNRRGRANCSQRPEQPDARPAFVGNRAQQGRHERHHEARYAVGDT